MTAVDASQLLWRLVSLNFPDNFWWNVGYNPGLKEGKHHSVEKSKESRPYRALLTAFYPQEPHKLSVSVLIFKMKKPKFRKVMSLAPGNTAPEDQNLDENGAHQDMKLMSSCRIPLTGPTWILQTGFPHSSVDKESACNAGGPSSIPGSGRSAREGINPPTPVFLGFPCGSAGKESTCNAGVLGSIHGLERAPGEGKATHASILAWRIPWTI